MKIIEKLIKAHFNEINGREFNWCEVFEVVAWIENPDVSKVNEEFSPEEWIAEDVETGRLSDVNSLPEDVEEAILIHVLDNNEYPVVLCKGNTIYTTLMPDSNNIDARNLVELFC